MAVHTAAALYTKFLCMVFGTFFPVLPVLDVLRGSILWVLLVLSVLQYCREWCTRYCAWWEYEQYEY